MSEPQPEDSALLDDSEVFIGSETYDQEGVSGQYGTTTNVNSNEAGNYPNDPNAPLEFEITPGEDSDESWGFTPIMYPEKFTQMKERELDEYGGKCGSQNVRVKEIKNRKVHISGILAVKDVAVFNYLMDFREPVDVISPIIPDSGMECEINESELGNQVGVDPVTKQRLFKYTIDLISTGKDEYEGNDNSIVTAILESGSDSSNGALESTGEASRRERLIEYYGQGETYNSSTAIDGEVIYFYKGIPRKYYKYVSGIYKNQYRKWVSGEIETINELIRSTPNEDNTEEKIVFDETVALPSDMESEFEIESGDTFT